MQTRLLELIACPACRAGLSIRDGDESGRRLWRGELVCAACGRTYSIRNGIPRLTPPAPGSDREQRTAEHFANEFTMAAEGARDLDSPEVLEYLFFTRTGIDPMVYARMPCGDYPTEVSAEYTPDGSFLNGKRVLDAGCGPGRFLRVAARCSDYVVGLDLGSHVDRARTYCEQLENVDLVQGSVLAPPFRAGAFDHVYSIGVVHHTEDPPRAAARLAELVASGGSMAIWVYSHRYWGNPIREATGKAVHAWLSSRDPEDALSFVRRWLYPLGRIQGVLARHRMIKWLAAPLFALNIPRHPVREVMLATIMDYFATPTIHTHDYDEVRGWLARAGFDDLRRLPVEVSWLALEKR